MDSWLGLIELFAVLLVGLGWAVLELVGLRLDRKRRERSQPERAAGLRNNHVGRRPDP